MNFMKKQLKGKCPHCRNIIAYDEITFYIDNDFGSMLADCSMCGEKFKATVSNPDESHFIKGGIKVDFFDYDSPVQKDASRSYNELTDKIEYMGSYNEKLRVFPLKTKSLYNCSSCNASLENKAYEELASKIDLINQENHNAINYILAHSRMADHKKIIVKIHFDCECDHKCKAVFYRKYDEFLGVTSEDYLLAGIEGALGVSSTANGILSKNDIMELLCKLIIRWNLISQKVVIATPFVGHQYLDNDVLVKLWDQVLSWLDSEKTKIYTRTRTLNDFKRAFKEDSRMDYSLLEEYELGNSVFDNAVKKNNFHAKLYMGISEFHTEILSGSANLVPGPSLENVNFSTFDLYENVYKNYINPLTLQGLERSFKDENEYSILLDLTNLGALRWDEVKYNQYSSLLY